jgi:hypothetical protein
MLLSADDRRLTDIISLLIPVYPVIPKGNKKAVHLAGHGWFTQKTGAPLVRGPAKINNAGERTSRVRHLAPPAPISYIVVHKIYIHNQVGAVNTYSE